MVNSPTIATAPGAAVAAAAAAAAESAPAATATAKAARRTPSRAANAATRTGTTLSPLDPTAVAAATRRAAGLLRTRANRVQVAGYAPAAALRQATSSTRTSSTAKASSAKSSSSSSSSALSFLSDPKLSIEEKLMRLLAYLNEKWQKEMQSKMDQIKASETAKAGSSSTTNKKSSGIVGKVASAVSSVIGGDAVGGLLGALKIPGVKAALGKIGGPVLAAAASALGFPAAAPILLKYGSTIVNAAAGVATAASSSGATAASATGGTNGAGTLSDSQTQLLTMEIQRLSEKQKEMFALVSNILRAGHDTRMATINNIR